MNTLFKNRHRERGSHELVFVAAITVALVGVLGFVGYNAWQKQSANAGGQNTIGSRAQINTATKKVATLKSSLVKANADYKKKVKNSDKASKEFQTYRNAQMKANATINTKFRAKWAADKAYTDKKAALEKQIAKLKKNGTSAKERKAIKSLNEKIASAKKTHKKAAAPAISIRDKWSTYKSYAAAQDAANKAQRKIADLKTVIKKAENTLKHLKQKKTAPKATPKTAPKAPQPKTRASCPSSKPVRGFAKGVCYPRYTAWKTTSCSTRKVSSEKLQNTCNQSRTNYYEAQTTNSGVGYRTETRQNISYSLH